MSSTEKKTERVKRKAPILKREYFLNRITKASGVPKATVRKVMNALPEVIYNAMSDCQRIRLCEGIILGGKMKEDDKKFVYSRFHGGVIRTRTLIRPTCEFGEYSKKQIKMYYNKKHGIESDDTED